MLQVNLNVYVITLTGPSTGLEKQSSFRKTLTVVSALTSFMRLPSWRAIHLRLLSGMTNQRVRTRACRL